MGHVQLYPWDSVVSFIFRHAPKNKARRDIKIFEVGFGTGSNLWFAAREGFSVAGIEGSRTAVDFARRRFFDENLDGDLRQGDIVNLPFDAGVFDIVIDRSALTCNEYEKIRLAIADISRVLKKNGLFLFTPFSTNHTSSNSGTAGPCRTRLNIESGTLEGINQVCFLSKDDITDLLANDWDIVSIKHMELSDITRPEMDIHAEWQVVAKKK